MGVREKYIISFTRLFWEASSSSGTKYQSIPLKNLFKTDTVSFFDSFNSYSQPATDDGKTSRNKYNGPL